jgi:protein-S-isoprenylcysteine O-methyltransferase Ste14
LRLWQVNAAGAWACCALLLAGFAFTWWARIHLGRLWSGAITRKEGHRLIDSGPYGIVRHPIYTGILVAIFGTMLAKGTVQGIAGALLAGLGLWIKARLEERWLASELGEASYADYRRRVPMLLPFGPKGR